MSRLLDGAYGVLLAFRQCIVYIAGVCHLGDQAVVILDEVDFGGHIGIECPFLILKGLCQFRGGLVICFVVCFHKSQIGGGILVPGIYDGVGGGKALLGIHCHKQRLIACAFQHIIDGGSQTVHHLVELCLYVHNDRLGNIPVIGVQIFHVPVGGMAVASRQKDCLQLSDIRIHGGGNLVGQVKHLGIGNIQIILSLIIGTHLCTEFPVRSDKAGSSVGGKSYFINLITFQEVRSFDLNADITLGIFRVGHVYQFSQFIQQQIPLVTKIVRCLYTSYLNVYNLVIQCRNLVSIAVNGFRQAGHCGI